MSDCSLAITNAIADTYQLAGQYAPQHYWCLFHVLKAYGDAAARYLHDRADKAIKDFWELVYKELADPEASYRSFQAKWEQVNPKFAQYVHKQWYKHYAKWATCFRTAAHQGIHTNNYVEGWHRVLKTKERVRVDELVQIFKNDVIPNYQMTATQVHRGIKKQTANKFQLRAKGLGESFTKEFLRVLGVTIVMCQNYFNGRKNQLTCCTCDHFSRHASGCKHMYFLAKELGWLVVETVAVGLLVDAVPQMGPETILIGEVELQDSQSDHGDQPDENLPLIDRNEDESSLNLMLESSVRAVQRATQVLKFAANRRVMQMHFSVLAANGLKERCEVVRLFVEERCKGVSVTYPSTIAEVSETVSMTGAEVEALVGSIVDEIWDCIKRTCDLVTKRKNKEEVRRKCSPELMGAFKEACWGIHETIKEGCRQPDGKQAQ
ncbi:hypothetical protein PGT21_031706 [Puccinia graminis f. sp. tritici]|uniref:SWIM-type domain-containing protein n=1 Tax=Puccinia graminis f. sp. tritici TaxID=56615 RepID=A0A5B0R258_PUCGR|nr:hypothetical protein PGT21_031706 [Puccinia graminis f. sp. tritici]